MRKICEISWILMINPNKKQVCQYWNRVRTDARILCVGTIGMVRDFVNRD